MTPDTRPPSKALLRALFFVMVLAVALQIRVGVVDWRPQSPTRKASTNPAQSGPQARAIPRTGEIATPSANPLWSTEVQSALIAGPKLEVRAFFVDDTAPTAANGSIVLHELMRAMHDEPETTATTHIVVRSTRRSSPIRFYECSFHELDAEIGSLLKEFESYDWVRHGTYDVPKVDILVLRKEAEKSRGVLIVGALRNDMQHDASRVGMAFREVVF